MNYFDFEGENYKTIFLMSSLNSFESLRVVFEHLASQRTVWNYLQIPVVFWHNPSTQSTHFFVHDIFILVTLVIVGPLLCVLWRILLSPQGSSHDYQSSLPYMYKTQILYHKKMLLTYYTCMCFDNCRRTCCWYRSPNSYCRKKGIVSIRLTIYIRIIIHFSLHFMVITWLTLDQGMKYVQS